MKYSTTLTGLSLVALLATGLPAATALDTSPSSPAQLAPTPGAVSGVLTTAASELTPHYASSPTGVWTVGAGKTYRTGAAHFTDSTGAPVPAPVGSTFAPNSSFPSWVNLNPLTGELTFAPPASVQPGHYPLSIYISYPGGAARSITVYALVAERSTDTENTGLASLYAPVQVPSLEVARPGETYTADLALYQEQTGAYIAGADLLALPDFSRIALPQDAASWVSVAGGSVLFALPVDVPTGVSTIWQTVEVIYSDGTSEYFNLFIPVDTGDSSVLPPAPEPSLEPTPAPTASPSAEPTVAPTPSPTVSPSAEPTATPSAPVLPVPTVAPTLPPSPTPVPTASPSVTATPSTSPTALPSSSVTPSESTSAPASSPAPSSSPVADKLARTGTNLPLALTLAVSLLTGGIAFAAISRRKTR